MSNDLNLHSGTKKGQPGIDQAALFASDDAPSGRALYLVVLPLIVVLMLAAVRLDDWLHPPLWVHALVWPPVVVVVIVGALRVVRRSPSPFRGGSQ